METVLQSIVAFIFGHKYYVNIINTRGTDRCEMSSYIHATKEQAEQHRQEIEGTSSFRWIETVTFRSRTLYASTHNSFKHLNR